MPNLIADLQAPPRQNIAFLDWFDALDDSSKKAMLDAARDPRWSHSSLEKMLRTNHKVACSHESIRAWREANGYSA